MLWTRLVAVSLQQALRIAEFDSTLRNTCCDKNVARHVHFRGCYTSQRLVELVSQQSCETRCKKNCSVTEIIHYLVNLQRMLTSIFLLSSAIAAKLMLNQYPDLLQLWSGSGTNKWKKRKKKNNAVSGTNAYIIMFCKAGWRSCILEHLIILSNRNQFIIEAKQIPFEISMPQSFIMFCKAGSVAHQNESPSAPCLIAISS